YIVLAPTFGLVGIGVVQVISVVLLNGAALWVAHRRLKFVWFDPKVLSWIYLLSAVLATLALSRIIVGTVELSFAESVTALIACLFAAYLVSLLVCIIRGLNADDLALISAVTRHLQVPRGPEVK